MEVLNSLLMVFQILGHFLMSPSDAAAISVVWLMKVAPVGGLIILKAQQYQSGLAELSELHLQARYCSRENMLTAIQPARCICFMGADCIESSHSLDVRYGLTHGLA